ncbi:MAG: long-chain fatty acid--CoA ligase [Sulfurimonadaceae bacterium]
MYSFTTLPELFEHIQQNVKSEYYLNYRNRDKWESISSDEFVKTVQHLSQSFARVGVVKGTAVGIISPSSPFWLMVDFALQNIGAISVPIFINIAQENLLYEVEDADVEYLFVANVEESEQLQKIINKMKFVIVRETLIDLSDENIMPWDEFLVLGEDQEPNDVAVVPTDLATIIYTSGSTGQPKGVELTHENLVIQIKDAQRAIPLYESDVILSLLPLAHIFERMVMLYYLASGTKIYFVDDIKKVGDFIKDVKPSVMVVVPRLLEKIYAKMHVNVEEAPLIKRLIATVAFWWARVRDPDVVERSFVDRVFDKIVYQKLLDALGGNFRVMISGGAPLSKPISKFFLNIGLPLYQGYGLTECSPVISVNRVGHNRWGSSGQAFEHVEVKLGTDSELLARGKNIMRGYHNKPAETAEAIDSDGWIHTGDLASIDADGYITIESRLKELYKTSTGKFVSAIKVESALMHSKWIEYAMVVAEGRSFVSALIFIDAQMLVNVDRKDTSAIKKIIDKRVTEVNRHLDGWERVRKYILIFETPTIESGLLTPSMKIIRNKVMEKYEKEIESIYMREEKL